MNRIRLEIPEGNVNDNGYLSKEGTMKVRLKFDHPHSWREWNAEPDKLRGFYNLWSRVRIWHEGIGWVYDQTFTLVVHPSEFETVNDD